ncbi:hypothetical protein BG842_02490 [Haladaptatus sp. W1]|nr:hypothetical protein BG842_26740 [Haladaptatus sp. W1]ODR80884.1 hypothetical protein BG842_02490 [Haladaptatus sp. W1]
MRNPTTSTSLDMSLDMLSSPHRRRILLAVLDDNPRDEDEFTSDATDDELTALKTQLHHVHLPKLADKGYIEWNPDTETIRRGPNFDEIAPLLTLMSNHADELPDDWP